MHCAHVGPSGHVANKSVRRTALLTYKLARLLVITGRIPLTLVLSPMGRGKTRAKLVSGACGS
jgi:hypothetical protein